MINQYTRFADPIDKIGDRDGVVEEYHQWIEPLMEDRFTHDKLIMKRFAIVISKEEIPLIANMPKTKLLLDQMKEEFDFTDVTYRLLMPFTTFSWHIDRYGYCLNMPLITNEGCRFVFDKKAVYMPADGSIFAVNNGIPHTFINAGSEPRLHLTFEIL